MKLLIRNLSRSTTEVQIHKMFEEFGKISAYNLVLDDKTGKSKGFAFVEMADDEQATRAMKALHEMMVDKSRIRVKIAE
ncbi:RNA recognition motif containing protein [Photobacterium sp. NCIMB 13483]|uniref:RNA recognition motif domain-containing protein n=1 Tax=Photobacterium sp. NCIMB 13483 TaxID=2022103 RepID=UPI000D1775C0|nr:RNA-binding protein [Photobacterium sp. NCIMB 13483]PST95026.1 RNA recognition motif containing protein [Photobacterium sp. NCIMB 13483]